MVRRRTTRNASMAKARVSAVKELSPEEQKRRENMNLRLKDFDKQLENRAAQMEGELNGVISAINNMYKVDLMKMAHSTRNMNFYDYVAQCQQDDTNPLVLQDAIAQVVEDVSTEVSIKVMQVEAITSTAKKKGGRGRKGKTSENHSTVPVRSSSRRETSTESNSSRILSDTSSNIETPSTVTRSTRGRMTRKDTETPVGTGKFASQQFITPRFNTATPLHRTVSRVARTNEVLVSLDGSPVQPLALRSKAAQAEAKQNALIPLGKGQTLNVPMNPDSARAQLDGFDLDDEAMSKLAEIHASLGNMLKMREENSASSDDN